MSQIDYSTGQPIVTQLDSYDPAGNRIQHVNGTDVTTWSYDPLDRLIGQQENGAWATFAYDPTSNLTLKWQQGTAPITFVNDAANRLQSSTQGAVITTVTFSPTGNQVLENALGELTSYQYDMENRLVRVQNSNGTLSTYTYSGGVPAEGEGLRRTAQEPGETVTSIIWDASDYLMEIS